MSTPSSRTKVDLPEETKHLSDGEVEAMENVGEAEHKIGPARERLIDESTKKADAEDQEHPLPGGQ